MRIVLAVAVILLSTVILTGSKAASDNCRTGDAQGFAAIRWSPSIVSTIPPRYTKDVQFFWRRYNCTGGGIYIRRLDRGVYDINFPGLGYRLATVSAISQEGVTASVQPFGTGVFRVVTRGPILDQQILARRDIPFSIVVH